MTGSIALHGGGEFLPGDERFLEALIELAPSTADPVRVVVIPTAAARGRPDLAAAHGVAAFGRIGGALGRRIEAVAVPVTDAASAADPAFAATISRAHVIHFPGGDPDLIPSLLRGSAAWKAVLEAVAQGAILAGASAGAMALGGWTWTRSGGVPGLGLVPNLVVMPHATPDSWDDAHLRFGSSVPPSTAAIGLAERTGVIVPPDGPWRVVGEGEVRWLPPNAGAPVILRDGDTIERP
jgi:cyanophycinase